jgi:hypothetical protein
MSALVTPGILEELEQENARLLSSDPGQQCRFCGCSEFNPCTILFAKTGSIIRLVFDEAEADYVEPCSWYVPGVCNGPSCIERLLIEARGRVLLFDGTGRRVG